MKELTDDWEGRLVCGFGMAVGEDGRKRFFFSIRPVVVEVGFHKGRLNFRLRKVVLDNDE